MKNKKNGATAQEELRKKAITDKAQLSQIAGGSVNDGGVPWPPEKPPEWKWPWEWNW